MYFWRLPRHGRRSYPKLCSQGDVSMPNYVTHGTVQFRRSPPTGGADPVEKVQIAPTDGYAMKHKDKRYIIFIGDPLPPNPLNPQSTKDFSVEYLFVFLPYLKDILMKSAFARTSLEITIND